MRLLLGLLFPLLLSAQIPMGGITGGSGAAATQYPGWTYFQNSYETANGNGGNYGACPQSGSVCQMGFFNLPTPLSQNILVAVMTSSNNVTIANVCSGNNCTPTVTNDNWTLCPNCHVFANGVNTDMAYCIGCTLVGTPAAITINTSSAPTGEFAWLASAVVPSGFTAAFQDSNHTSSGLCTACSLATLTLSGTDLVLHFPGSLGGPGNATPVPVFTTPFMEDFNGGLWGLNVVSGDTVPTFPQASGIFSDSAIAFKTTANFTRDTDTQFYTVVQHKNVQALGCNPGPCTFSYRQNTGGGNLVVLLTADGNGVDLSTVAESTGGSASFTVPAGCKVHMTGTTNNHLGCAILTNSTSGASAVSITPSTTGATFGVTMWEIKRASGTWTGLDGSIQSANDASCSLCTGVTLSPTGTHGDVEFAAEFCPGGCNVLTLYPDSTNEGGNGMIIDANSSGAVLINTKSSTPPTIGYTNNPMLVLGFAIQ